MVSAEPWTFAILLHLLSSREGLHFGARGLPRWHHQASGVKSSPPRPDHCCCLVAKCKLFRWIQRQNDIGVAPTRSLLMSAYLREVRELPAELPSRIRSDLSSLVRRTALSTQVAAAIPPAVPPPPRTTANVRAALCGGHADEGSGLWKISLGRQCSLL